MGKKLEKLKSDNFENMKVGFLLELKFNQDLLNDYCKKFILFLNDNHKFFKSIDLCSVTQAIDSFYILFLNFTDLLYKDVDPSDLYCKFYKDFY